MKPMTINQRFARERNSAKWKLSGARAIIGQLSIASGLYPEEHDHLREVLIDLNKILENWKPLFRPNTFKNKMTGDEKV